MMIRCLVENSVQRSSRYWGEHGVSFHLETDTGAQVLFDTGSSGTVLLHNAARFGLDLATVDALALSHAHYDHTGGLAAFFGAARAGIPLYANPDLFRARYARHGDKVEFIGIELAREEIERHAEPRLSAEPVEIAPGVWTTGEITARPYFEGRSVSHLVKADAAAGEGWQPDPYRDDLSLVVHTARGLVVLCGCCHAGLLNTLAHTRRHFAGRIAAVMGGTHLASAADEDLALAARELRETYGAPHLYLAHCSGERAYVAMVNAFGHKRVRPFPVGSTLAL